MYNFFFIVFIFLTSETYIFSQIKFDVGYSDAAITQEELKQHIDFLAADSLNGRRAGTADDFKAAKYIMEQFKSYGLKQINEDGFQFFDINSGIQATDHCSLHYNGKSAILHKDFIPLSFSENKNVSAEVVFLGYGFDKRQETKYWNDYSEVDLKDKIAMILLGSPDEFFSSEFETIAEMRQKLLSAKDNGALAVIFVASTKYFSDDNLLELKYDRVRTKTSIPAVQISKEFANLVLTDNGYSLEYFEDKYITEKKPFSFSLGKNFDINVELVPIKKRTQNVVALIESPTQKENEKYLVIGAHYDHLGLGGFGSGSRRPDTMAVHNGADDNASGVAAILEIAKKLSQNKDKISQNILFVGFGAEEEGLLGSSFFVNNPPIDLKKISCMINLDMVGRIDSIEKVISVMGTGTSKEFSGIIDNIPVCSGYKVKKLNEGTGPSDQAPFYSKDIPVLFFFATLHEDYHTPFDDIDKINFEGLKTISEYIYDCVLSLSNYGVDFTFQEAGPKTQSSSYRGNMKVSLGIMPDHTSIDIKGVKAASVIKGKPASNAGMEKDDIIIALEGKIIDDIYDYMNRMSEFSAGQRISVDVIRDNKKIVLIVQL